MHWFIGLWFLAFSSSALASGEVSGVAYQWSFSSGSLSATQRSGIASSLESQCSGYFTISSAQACMAGAGLDWVSWGDPATGSHDCATPSDQIWDSTTHIVRCGGLLTYTIDRDANTGPFSVSGSLIIYLDPTADPPPPPEPELLEWECGTWSENTFNFTSGGPDMCVDGQMYAITEEASPVRNTDYEPDGTIICRDWYVSTGESCTGGVVSNPGSGEGSEEWPAAHYCDDGGGSDGVSFCDTRDPNHPEYDPNLPPVNEGDIYCDDQGGHDGLSWCNTWSPHHPAHPDYDGTGDGDGGTSGDGSYPGPGGGGTGGTGEGGEGEDPPQIGFCPPGTVQSERHFHGEDQTAVCVPEGDEFDESLDGLDLSGELPPGWLVMPTLPEPSAGTCSCPEDHVISVMGSSVPISYGPICGVAELLRPVFLLLVYLGLAVFLFRMVAGGNK